MKTLKDLLGESILILEQNQIKNARRQAEEVIADALEMKRLDLYLQFDRPLNEKELEKCENRIVRRSRGEPVQYIKGSVAFLDCVLCVNSDVLIPRQETEILVSKMIAQLEKEERRGKIFWDICSGSGCIGIAIKKKFPELTVVLSDLSRGALKMAEKNANCNRAALTCVHGDLLEPFKGKKADYIVCNPPYVSEEDYVVLEREVKNHEPKMALVAENKGLLFYQRFAQEISNYLNPQAKVWFEMGDRQGDALLELFNSPLWRTARVENDWSQKNRFFFLEME